MLFFLNEDYCLWIKNFFEYLLIFYLYWINFCVKIGLKNKNNISLLKFFFMMWF